MKQKIYKIVTSADWQNAQKTTAFAGSAADLRDGFIHFSNSAQVRGTAERYFGGQDGLVLVAVDAGALGEALKWEVSRGGEPFPHLYGHLPMSAIVWTKPLLLGPDGRHCFPEDIN